jgi:hypothetical protein
VFGTFLIVVIFLIPRGAQQLFQLIGIRTQSMLQE